MGRTKVNSYKIEALNTQDSRLKRILALLDLPFLSQNFIEMANMAEKKNYSYLDFLEQCVSYEASHKEEDRVRRWHQQAKFPFFKTYEDFDMLEQSVETQRKLKDLSSGRFIEKGVNLILLGAVGVGKTHLAIALSSIGIHKGKTVKFSTLRQFLTAFQVALGESREKADRLMRSYLNPDILVLDNLEPLNVSEQIADLLFLLIDHRYDHNKTIIITTNYKMEEFESLFIRKERALSAIDRIYGRNHNGDDAEILRIEGTPRFKKNK